MPVLCVGLSHHSAPVALRESLAFSRDAIHEMLTGWDHDQAWREGIGEIALLSTCNRTEVYLASRGPSHRLAEIPPCVERTLLAPLEELRDPVREHLYIQSGAEAVRHLCRVAAGLDSMLIGEYEVLGQVVAAHGLAADAGTTGLILDATFRAAIRAGRRARAETGVGRGATSIASEGVCLLDDQLGPSGSNATILVVGTGAMARLVTGILRGRTAGTVRVVGRNRARAEELARHAGGTGAPWSELPGQLRDADAVISVTTSPRPVVTAELVRNALRDRDRTSRMICLDLAMPRDIELEAGTVDGVRLFDLDDLHIRVARNRRARESERPRVEAIVQQEVTQFEAWLQGATLRPVLAAMHTRGEEVRRQEVERFLLRHPEADPSLREEFDQLSRSIVAKLLHGPSARLRTETDPARSRHYVSALRHLFGLPGPNEDSPVGSA